MTFVGEKDIQLVELVGDQNRDSKEPRSKIGREKREQRRRVGMSGLLRGRRSEEMTQLKTSSLRESEVPFVFQRG